MAKKRVLKSAVKGTAKATKRAPNWVPVNMNPTARTGTQVPITVGPTRRGPTPTSTRMPMPTVRNPVHGPPVPAPYSNYYPGKPKPPGPPPKDPGYFAKHGKKTAAAVAGGLMVGGAIKNRTGKAVDPTTGLPKGMYGY